MYVKINILVEIETVSLKKFRFTALHDIIIKSSVDKVESSCSFEIPTSAALVFKGEKTASVQVAKTFSKGDKIKVQLGYGDDLRNEFEGFIYRVNLTTPLEIECIGYEYLLLDEIKTKTFKETTLRNLLKYIIAGTVIELDGAIPSVNMKNYIIPANITGIDALNQIKERYGLSVYFAKKKLYAGLDFIKNGKEVKYSLGENTVKAGELKYQYADDVKLKIKAIQINKDNSKLEVEIGDPKGEKRTLYFYNAKSKEDLKKLAAIEIKKYKYSGYNGRLTTFLQPFAAAGMTANIEDKKYEQRGGKYEIRSVTTSVGNNGGRRVLEIGKTIG